MLTLSWAGKLGDTNSEMAREHTKGLPIRRELAIEVSLAEDGTATVVLKKGPSNEIVAPLPGPHKLR
jgi:hypothetical protein